MGARKHIQPGEDPITWDVSDEMNPGGGAFIMGKADWVTLPPEIAQMAGKTRGYITKKVGMNCPKCEYVSRARILDVIIQDKTLAVVDCRVCNEFLWVTIEKE